MTRFLLLQGLEKYLLTKLYDRTFAQDPMDRERDQVLAARITALQFIRPEHLEIAEDFAVDGTLALAQKELKKINMYKVWGVEGMEREWGGLTRTVGNLGRWMGR